MQNNFLTTIRSLKIIDGCKGSQVYAFPSTSGAGTSGERPPPLRPNFSLRSKSVHYTQPPCHNHSLSILTDSMLPFGLPSVDTINPPIDPHLRPVDPVSTLADMYRRLAAAECDREADLCDLHLEQHSVLRSMNDLKLLRRALRAARVHASDVHRRVVLSAWLRYERREDEFVPAPAPLAPCTKTSPSLECPKATLYPDPPGMPLNPYCPCHPPASLIPSDSTRVRHRGEADADGDLWFIIGEEEVLCVRSCIAALSIPLNALLYGGFAEAQRDRIDFTHNGISVSAMKAVDVYSRTGQIDSLSPEIIVELLSFSNKFCCEELKANCDARLAAMVHGTDGALQLIEYGLEETSYLLVAACLQCFLRELPHSLHDPDVARLLCSPEGRERLEAAGNASFALYYFLSQVAMEEDMKSNTTIMLLERLGECAAPGWQRQQAMHQLGCVMLERGEYKDAQRWFEEAAKDGHIYSWVGVARAKYKRGHKYAAYKLLNTILDQFEPAGWMYQERSLYCVGKEKLNDLVTATSLDPTLSYPYKYRAITLMEEDKVGAAIVEVNKILGFKVSTDLLELRAWFFLAQEDYKGAMQDVRALMTLDPGYLFFHGKVHGDHLIEAMRGYVQQMDMADCWLQLYDRWSAVDDIGSLAVVHQMLAKEPNSGLRFRQSLLLLRLNCQKAAMRSLRQARNSTNARDERLVYEGWILYDTGHKEEALEKAEESINVKRTFEALFLKAYALGDNPFDDRKSADYVINILEAAVNCASDNLRKGQAFNNMGSIYVDIENFAVAESCYEKALGLKHTRAHQGLARVFYVTNRKKAAYDEMTKLIEKAKNNASAYEKRSEYCERENAMSDLNTATTLDPLRTYPYRYRAAVMMDDRREDDAIAELTRVINFKPDLQLLHLRAAFYESMHKTELAVRDCEAALCFEPTHGDTLDLYHRARGLKSEEPHS
ncbi:Ethylene-overproduction protein 1 [Rhynchospora pubera]|uniref:Ethylene-overproduction protein 1 n=1 Tax=Rhynchospora pubera TaxID=906938 RepID=A0AAV8FS73_9POAL|nr:Ethylene-overproduction protein 1 [Rhynchospora pubera]